VGECCRGLLDGLGGDGKEDRTGNLKGGSKPDADPVADRTHSGAGKKEEKNEKGFGNRKGDTIAAVQRGGQKRCNLKEGHFGSGVSWEISEPVNWEEGFSTSEWDRAASRERKNERRAREKRAGTCAERVSQAERTRKPREMKQRRTNEGGRSGSRESERRRGKLFRVQETIGILGDRWQN